MTLGESHARNLCRITALGLAIACGLSACASAGRPDAGSAAESAQAQAAYATKTPYAPQQDPASYQKPPAGFSAVFVEHVARHGSRAMTGAESADLAMQMWQKARDEGALTPLGESFGPAVERLLAAHEKLGYGNLSARGVREHREMAARVARRLPELFARIGARSERIDIVSSGKDRAVDSARNFAESLAAAEPAVAAWIGSMRVDKDLLYFHKATQNADYQAYTDNDPQLKAALDQVHGLARSREVARHLLERLFAPAFVERLASGKLSFVDRTEGEDRIDNEVDAALVVYDLYQIAPGMSEEGDWRMDRFVEAGDAAWLAYQDDAEDFYEKGPAFAGRDISYRMAGVLLDDFFARVDDRIAGRGNVGAVFRFAHAEEIIPLAALMRLPGSTEPVAPGQMYDYADNPWRGAKVSPMAANVQWDVFGDGKRHLVRMLYNEKETPFKADCTPVAPGSVFYDFIELKRCFGRD